MNAFHWQCHICGKIRRNVHISVYTKALEFGDGIMGSQNVRYCNDNQLCINGAPDHNFMRDIPKPEPVPDKYVFGSQDEKPYLPTLGGFGYGALKLAPSKLKKTLLRWRKPSKKFRCKVCNKPLVVTHVTCGECKESPRKFRCKICDTRLAIDNAICGHCFNRVDEFLLGHIRGLNTLGWEILGMAIDSMDTLDHNKLRTIRKFRQLLYWARKAVKE